MINGWTISRKWPVLTFMKSCTICRVHWRLWKAMFLSMLNCFSMILFMQLSYRVSKILSFAISCYSSSQICCIESTHSLHFTEPLWSVYELWRLLSRQCRMYWICKCDWWLRLMWIDVVKICSSVMKLWSSYQINLNSQTFMTSSWLFMTL